MNVQLCFAIKANNDLVGSYTKWLIYIYTHTQTHTKVHMCA